MLRTYKPKKIRGSNKISPKTSNPQVVKLMRNSLKKNKPNLAEKTQGWQRCSNGICTWHDRPSDHMIAISWHLASPANRTKTYHADDGEDIHICRRVPCLGNGDSVLLVLTQLLLLLSRRWITHDREMKSQKSWQHLKSWVRLWLTRGRPMKYWLLSNWQSFTVSVV